MYTGNIRKYEVEWLTKQICCGIVVETGCQTRGNGADSASEAMVSCIMLASNQHL